MAKVLPTALTMGTSLIQAGLERSAGSLAAGEGRLAAQQEELAATQRESDRKQRLAEALASQNARAGAAGVRAFEGSPLSVMQEDMRRQEQATERDRFQAELAGLTARSRGNLARKRLQTQSLLTLGQGLGESI